MKVSLCTISFRHQLISFADIVEYAIAEQFAGIELWGAHAHALYNGADEQLWTTIQKMRQHGIDFTMLSDYFDLYSDETAKVAKTIELCQVFGITRVRTFAGQTASKRCNEQERAHMVERLRALCEQFAPYDIDVLIETHPNTLADTLPSTLQLLEEVNHPTLKVNFDVLHLWETGVDPLVAWAQLKPFVRHFHLKNISQLEHVRVFEPNNVYAAAGSREGMVSLFAGAIAYEDILRGIGETPYYASLEWFGANPLHMLAHDRKQLTQIAHLV